MSLPTTVRALSLGVLLSGLAPAYAEFSLIAPTTVTQGEKGITVSLFDSFINGLEAANLLFTYNTAVFEYVNYDFGSATGGFSLFAHETLPGMVEISLAADFVLSGESGSLVDILLDVRDKAPPGLSSTPPNIPGLMFRSTSTDYRESEETSGNVTVTPAGTTPEPVTSMLIGMAMCALALVHRRPARVK